MVKWRQKRKRGFCVEQTRLARQMAFLTEVDRMKSIYRHTLLTDRSRRETDAEHSWHFALMAMLLSEYAGKDVDPNRVIRMALVHDLVELYAGDTFAYDSEGKKTQHEREAQAANKLFSLLPADQEQDLRALWEEFDAKETPDARFACAVDRIQPFLNNCLTEGHTWKEGHVTSTQVRERLSVVQDAMPAVWPLIDSMLRESVEKGYLME